MCARVGYRKNGGKVECGGVLLAFDVGKLGDAVLCKPDFKCLDAMISYMYVFDSAEEFIMTIRILVWVVR